LNDIAKKEIKNVLSLVTIWKVLIETG